MLRAGKKHQLEIHDLAATSSRLTALYIEWQTSGMMTALYTCLRKV